MAPLRTLLLLLALLPWAPAVHADEPPAKDAPKKDASEEKGPADPDDPEQMPPELRKRWERQKRQEMMQRKADLPDTAKPTLQIIERFAKEQLRLWMVPLDRVGEQGENAIPALILMLEDFDWEVRAFCAACSSTPETSAASVNRSPRSACTS